MSLIDLASLVLAPTATKEGKVYSAIPDTGDGDMTFTRGSAATRVNSAGLIEKERANLLLQSNSFDTTWTTANASVTSGQVGYDGSSDAWLLTDDAVNGSHDVRQSISIGGLKTISVYAKAGTLNFLKVYSGASLTYFNLSTGEVGTNGHSGAYMEDVGGGWYRCSLFDTATFTFALFGVTNANNVASYSGTGSGSIYIQDAQLEQGLVATDYIETTTSAVYEGITDDVPRVDYSGGGCPSLLLEPQRTNLITNSEQLNNAVYTLTNVSVTPNSSVSPDGYTNADTILSTADSPQLLSPVITFASATNVSIFVKYVSQRFVQLFGGGAFGDFANFDLQNATLGTSGASTANAKIENYGNGWLRISATFSGFAGATTARLGFTSASNAGWNSLDAAFNKSVLAYGFQVEAGNYSTSYIPTYSVSSTRVADSCSKTGISELIGQTEGVSYAEFKGIDLDVYTILAPCLSDGTTNNLMRVYYNPAANGVAAFARSGGLVQVNTSTATSINDGTNKIAFAYSNNDFVVYLNGSLIINDTSISVPACSKVSIGSNEVDGGIEVINKTQAILFPTRLTNDQLEELTK